MPLTRSRPSPLGAVARGLAAGAAGTAAMTAAQTVAYKIQGAESSTTPGEVLKRIIEGVLQRGPVPEERMGLLTNVMHWTYGTSWGAVYGLAQGTARGPALRAGLLFGTGVWGASLVELPAMKLAPPVWQYPPASLVQEVAFHLVYGTAAAGAYRALAP